MSGSPKFADHVWPATAGIASVNVPVVTISHRMEGIAAVQPSQFVHQELRGLQRSAKDVAGGAGAVDAVVARQVHGEILKALPPPRTIAGYVPPGAHDQRAVDAIGGHGVRRRKGPAGKDRTDDFKPGREPVDTGDQFVVRHAGTRRRLQMKHDFRLDARLGSVLRAKQASAAEGSLTVSSNMVFQIGPDMP